MLSLIYAAAHWNLWLTLARRYDGPVTRIPAADKVRLG